MTYRKLLEELNKLSERQLELNVTAYINHSDEFWPIESIDFVVAESEDDRLEVGHPYLYLEE